MGIDRKAVAAEAKRRSLADDGKTSKGERFEIRNAIRAEQGFRPEERTRGGLAGLYDRNKEYALPAALLAAPFLLPALGVGGAAGAAGAGAATAGTAATAAASPFSLASIGSKLGGIASTVGKAATSNTGRSVLAGLQGLSAANQRRKANATMDAQLGRENALYAQAAPLRLAGVQGMLSPQTPDLSRLDEAKRRASNYAGNLSAPLPLGGR